MMSNDVRLFREVLSIRNILPFSHLASCRFYPSCSNYAQQAFKRYGVLSLGPIMWRLVRCQPFANPGFDPVK